MYVERKQLFAFGLYGSTLLKLELYGSGEADKIYMYIKAHSLTGNKKKAEPLSLT
jgi:hypothetical protein